jgi:hypothetical protein
VMALVMCALSIVEHLFLLICLVCPYTGLDYSSVTYLYFAADFAICLKHTVNIFIFYGFNKNFKKVFFKYFKCCWNESEYFWLKILIITDLNFNSDKRGNAYKIIKHIFFTKLRRIFEKKGIFLSFTVQHKASFLKDKVMWPRITAFLNFNNETIIFYILILFIRWNVCLKNKIH